ncbi:MAG: alpha-ketoacid dehydrogenase subunit beta, partial [Candidatus Bathyarchaeia archaeon]
MREITYAEAIREALREEMARDERVFIMGESINYGLFGVTAGLREEFGAGRVKNAPISEASIVGAALGAALTGMRPVAEIMFADFLFCAMDSIANEAAKWRYMIAGQASAPLVIRAPQGSGLGMGCHHSQSPEWVFAHFPGLKVAAPSTPYDAKGLLKASIRDDNPVLFFEHKMLYRIKGPVPEGEYIVPLGRADMKREGSDATIVATSLMVHRALEAAEELAKEGISAEVIDPRTLSPLDKEAILESVRKTGRLIIAEEACKTGGFGAELAAMVAEEAIDALDAPIRRVAAFDVPIPSGRLEEAVIPKAGDIANAV